jgi:hypothetical protein
MIKMKIIEIPQEHEEGTEAKGKIFNKRQSGFGGLEVARWPLVPKFAGSHPAEAVRFLGRRRSSAHLPSEGN